MEGLFPYLKKLLFGEPKPEQQWKLYATYHQPIQWEDCNGLQETITYYLWIDEQGNRDYTVHEYGYCKIYNEHEKYLAGIITWKHGGPLPPYARLLKQDNVLKLVK